MKNQKPFPDRLAGRVESREGRDEAGAGFRVDQRRRQQRVEHQAADRLVAELEGLAGGAVQRQRAGLVQPRCKFGAGAAIAGVQRCAIP